VLGDLALEDGNQTMAILALQDAYGEGLAAQAEKSFTAGGGESS
jgi:branched-chain amino acid transport system substrate-binding protein